MTIVLLEDKLGVTSGYSSHWESMLLKAGIMPTLVRRFSTYKSPTLSRLTLLTKKGNRKSPGFNPDAFTQSQLLGWVEHTLSSMRAELVLCMDTALLGLVEPAWDIATIDNLRGGIYDFNGIPWIVIQPVSVIHSMKQPKDIRILNDGAESEEEYEEQEHDPNELWLEPYTYPLGKRVLAADLAKAARIYKRIQDAKRVTSR